MTPLLALHALLDAPAAAAPYAVVIGAERPPPGRTTLRYASSDAGAVAELLTELGGVPPERTRVLTDPSADDVLAALAAVPAGTDTLLVYYSGHADAAALYPDGRALPIDALKRAIDAAPAELRIGVLDACSGGGWTGAKGLSPARPFDVAPTLGAGTVYVAASSGAEDAHELEALGGSVFTHHWVAGLRGPADADRDGRVTLGESFDWARARTIHDSTVFTGRTQHPSFHYDLRGRQDVVLTDLRGARSAVTVTSAVDAAVHRLDDGLHVADLEGNDAPSILVLPPGTYLARRGAAPVEVAEFTVQAGAPVAVPDDAFRAVDGPGLIARKGDAPLGVLQMAPKGGQHTGQVLVGSWVGPMDQALERELALRMSLIVGLSERWMLSFPGVGFRVGRAGGPEVLLFAGGYNTQGGFTLPPDPWSYHLTGDFGGGVDTRSPVSEEVALVSSVAVQARARVGTDGSEAGDPSLVLGLGTQWRAGRSVLVHPSFGADTTLVGAPAVHLRFGGALQRGPRVLPLVQLRLDDELWVDLDASLRLDPGGRPAEQTLMIGLSTFTDRRAAKQR